MQDTQQQIYTLLVIFEPHDSNARFRKWLTKYGYIKSCHNRGVWQHSFNSKDSLNNGVSVLLNQIPTTEDVCIIPLDKNEFGHRIDLHAGRKKHNSAPTQNNASDYGFVSLKTKDDYFCLILSNKHFVAESKNSLLFSVPLKGYEGFCFWHPKKMLKQNKTTGDYMLQYTSDWEFNLCKYAPHQSKGSYLNSEKINLSAKNFEQALQSQFLNNTRVVS